MTYQYHCKLNLQISLPPVHMATGKNKQTKVIGEPAQRTRKKQLDTNYVFLKNGVTGLEMWHEWSSKIMYIGKYP